MPTDRTKSAPKSKASGFKPPRPVSKAKATAAAAPRRKSAPAKPTSISLDSSEDEDKIREASKTPEADAPCSLQDAPPTVPPKLLTKLLHHHFENDKTRMSKDASLLVGKYVDTFVREAIARATFERTEAGGDGSGGDFLEVSQIDDWCLDCIHAHIFRPRIRLKIWKSWRRSLSWISELIFQG